MEFAEYGEDEDGDGFGGPPGFQACEHPGPPFQTPATDCDDRNQETYPRAPEACDGNDNDCDGDIPDDELDSDLDLIRTCEGDCNDNREEVSPELPEVCGDTLDNDCDGETDEGCGPPDDSITCTYNPRRGAPSWLWLPFFLALGVIRSLAKAADRKEAGLSP